MVLYTLCFVPASYHATEYLAHVQAMLGGKVITMPRYHLQVHAHCSLCSLLHLAYAPGLLAKRVLEARSISTSTALTWALYCTWDLRPKYGLTVSASILD